MRQEVVLFNEDWHSGASAWSAQRPEAYADDHADATHLAADTARSNWPKSDQDPAEGLPLAGEAHCRYLTKWEGMKLRWAPSADEAEAAALREVADGCPEQAVAYEPTP
ncbi:hypothetical protein PEM37_39370 [Streptomyces sp. AD681]|uniref:hypothetical protein n=1 Tax=Streptomyces sp. AD681 TaxID=3019069 RepID=UPI0022F18B17|nr:hypothetical protein [Streptomyces sp. AD681]MDA5147562.1 hypothetical protein [Streptomyces sp. AD681]